MKLFITVMICLAAVAACTAPKSATTSGKGHTRRHQVVLLDNQTYLLTEAAPDKTYGFVKSNPVNVGGTTSEGAANQRRFLNALLGPEGEPVTYFREGSCCAFKTPNGLINNTGLLDIYRVTWEGSRDTLSIYLNFYDEGDLYIPYGFTAKRM